MQELKQACTIVEILMYLLNISNSNIHNFCMYLEKGAKMSVTIKKVILLIILNMLLMKTLKVTWQLMGGVGVSLSIDGRTTDVHEAVVATGNRGTTGPSKRM